MSIINAITSGRGGAWFTATNTSASSSLVSFPVEFQPSAWILLLIETSSTTSSYIMSCYSGDDNGTRKIYGVYYNSSPAESSDDRFTQAYNSSTGQFTIGTPSSTSLRFASGAGKYMLIYI